ncbi:TPA: type I-E CRISPR-associated protein Cas6/Cse3/CasE, partial [Escherichia coli]
MYLSKVIIARAWSRDLYQLHQGLWHLFPNRPDAARDFLFHVEKRNTPEGCHVLLQSAQMPVSTAVATVIKTKQVEFQLQVGVPLYFRLRANPIKTILDNQKRLDSKGNIKRCRVPLIKEAEQIAWLQRKLGNAARVEDVHPISERPQYFSGDGKSGKIQTVCFEGVITINNAPALI